MTTEYEKLLLTDDEINESWPSETLSPDMEEDIKKHVAIVCQAQHLKTLNGILNEIDGILDDFLLSTDSFVVTKLPHNNVDIPFSAYLRQQLQVEPPKSKE